eukprot:gene4535-9002_t
MAVLVFAAVALMFICAFATQEQEQGNLRRLIAVDEDSKNILQSTLTPSCPIGALEAISFGRLNSMIEGIATYICSEGGGYYDKKNNACNTDTKYKLTDSIGGVLRLSFHDAVTYDNWDFTGGPDGCVDITSPYNGGLSSIWFNKVNTATPFSLDGLYMSYSSFSSKADFIALAGNVAVMLARGPDISGRIGAICTCVGTDCPAAAAIKTNPCVAFRWGRKDSTDCATTDIGRFPSATLAHDHILEVFHSRLGFSNEEIVALMGAHTVGRAELERSHFGIENSGNAKKDRVRGRWASKPYLFDNNYYQALTSMEWTLQTHDKLSDGVTPFYPKTFQWEKCGSQIMLNTDMALVWDVTPSPTNPLAVACDASILGGNDGTSTFSKCSENKIFSTYVTTFADATSGLNAWFVQWVSAWTKMQEMGWVEGKKGVLHAISDSICF